MTHAAGSYLHEVGSDIHEVGSGIHDAGTGIHASGNPGQAGSNYPCTLGLDGYYHASQGRIAGYDHGVHSDGKSCCGLPKNLELVL